MAGPKISFTRRKNGRTSTFSVEPLKALWLVAGILLLRRWRRSRKT